MALGTGQALDAARRGDADVVFVHAKELEEKFVADGFGVKRYPIMYNDSVLIGPHSDPAGINGMHDVVAVFEAIEAHSAPFISRGDRSGTHVRELDLWKAAGIEIAKDKVIGARRSVSHAPRRFRVQRLYAFRSRHMDLVQDPRRT